MLYLKDGDDLNLTMNAAEFDETIVYKGKGEKENNFLAQKALTDEAFELGLESLLEKEEAVFKAALEKNQITKAEISYGTIGPSLYQYGKNRGVADVASPTARPIIEYTWAKMWNAKAYNACSGMPRFGHAGLLDEKQLKDLMALILDPKSPVNQ